MVNVSLRMVELYTIAEALEREFDQKNTFLTGLNLANAVSILKKFKKTSKRKINTTFFNRILTNLGGI